MPDNIPAVPPSPVVTCRACGNQPAMQWQRRPTEAELAALVEAEEARRAQALLLADPQKPAPVFGPLPSADSTVLAVVACADHAIQLDDAARIHAAVCSAPHPDHLPSCDCTPEPHPEPEELGVPQVILPTGWAVPAPPSAA